MKAIFPVLMTLLTIGSLMANPVHPKYSYLVDLENIREDQVYVELITPEIRKGTIQFYLPKVVPGTYSIYDFGRFVSAFRAEDVNGRELHVERSDINTFVIYDARKLHKISYWVDDTFDDRRGVPVSGMSGTSIEEDGTVVLNGHGFFGYFENMKELPFEITVKKQEGFYGASAMTATYPDAKTEVFNANNYHYLVDMPILYSRPDTTTVKVGNTDVLIAVNSPTGNVTSEYIAEHFAEVLEAERLYMGGKLPVDKYAFLMHFLSPGQHVGQGALEHNYSSLYVLSDVPQERFIQPIMDIAAHEFFHIITPLNVHAEQIRYFNFNDPEMSRHLWMYEGVTEYFSHHAQYVAGVTDFNYFLDQMQDKISTSLGHFDDQLPFTTMSKDCLTDYQGQYGNVYEKGALIGLCLDVILRQESGGSEGLIDLMLELMNKYGKDAYFKDRKLFKEIQRMTYPEAGAFLRKYVSGKNPLPLEEVFAAIGVKYSPPTVEEQFTFGNISLNYIKESNRVEVVSLDHANDFAKRMRYHVGDQIVSINGKQFDPSSPMMLFFSEREKFVKGDLLTVHVARKDENGREKIVSLSAPIQTVMVPGKAKLEPMDKLSPEQKRLQQSWSQGAKGSFRGRS